MKSITSSVNSLTLTSTPWAVGRERLEPRPYKLPHHPNTWSLPSGMLLEFNASSLPELWVLKAASSHLSSHWFTGWSRIWFDCFLNPASETMQPLYRSQCSVSFTMETRSLPAGGIASASGLFACVWNNLSAYIVIWPLVQRQARLAPLKVNRGSLELGSYFMVLAIISEVYDKIATFTAIIVEI